jgi:hypothetical protein
MRLLILILLLIGVVLVAPVSAAENRVTYDPPTRPPNPNSPDVQLDWVIETCFHPLWWWWCETDGYGFSWFYPETR